MAILGVIGKYKDDSFDTGDMGYLRSVFGVMQLINTAGLSDVMNGISV